MSLKIIIQLVYNIASWIVLIAFIILGLFTLSSNTNLLGNYRSYVVLSGSMEPSIRISDIIIIGQRDRYNQNDVITFKFENHLVTHRIASVIEKSGSYLYLTKGDANRSEDDGQVDQANVLGKVIFVIPKLGQFVAFTQSPLGLVFLIGLPVLGLLFDTFVKKGNA